MRARAARTVVIALLLVATSGCNDDKGSATEPTAPATAGESGTTPPDPSPSVAPATGKRIELRSLTVRLTDDPDWISTGADVNAVATIRLPAGRVDVSVGDIGAATDDLDRNAESALATKSLGPPQTRTANRTIHGVEVFVLEGEDAERRTYELGGVSQDYYFNIKFDLPAGWPEADALIESILASIEFNPDPPDWNKS